MKKLKIIIILIVVLIFTGLLLFAVAGPMSRPIIMKELIGRYEVQLPDGGKEILQLLPDEACKQDICLKDGKVYSAKGTWRLDEFNLSECVMLREVRCALVENATKLNPEINKIENDTLITLPIHHTFIGHVEIGMYGGQGIMSYRKISE